MQRDATELAIYYDPMRRGYPVQFYFSDDPPFGKVPLREIHVVDIDSGEERRLGELVLTGANAQTILDSLWASGLRPSHDATPGQLKAVTNHVTDVQNINNRLLTLVEKHHEYNERTVESLLHRRTTSPAGGPDQ